MANKKEWTVMFYFASDNPLAAICVSQLKAIKDAGFQENTDVVVYFDPNENGTPTYLHHVNNRRRAKSRLKTRIGDDEDSYVRNMIEDDVEFEEERSGGPLAKMKALLDDADNVPATESLNTFLDYCVEAHPAEHYLLFLVGHGMVVGTNSFLPDEQPVSAIGLKELGGVMNEFKKKVGDSFELLALHSCSMSGVEVAYELRDTARYMMASEGLAFIGSWPYRQLLKRLFRAVEKGEAKTREDIDKLIEKLYFLSYFNATDFRVAGYPLDLALCSLESQRYTGLSKALVELVGEMRQGLQATDSPMKELIQLAHLEAQSYYDENYTDLYDFCLCMSRYSKRFGLDASINQYADNVRKELEPDLPEPVVIHSKYFGWRCQYSHGLSIYFPWTEPFQKPDKKVEGQRAKRVFLKEYGEYKFTSEFKGNAWINFLEDYFKLTMRASRNEEDKARNQETISKDASALDDLGGFAPPAPGIPGALEKPTGGYEKPTGGSGPSCLCPSIKNYPKEVV